MMRISGWTWPRGRGCGGSVAEAMAACSAARATSDRTGEIFASTAGTVASMKHTRPNKPSRRTAPMVLDDHALVRVIGGDQGVIHMQNALGGGHLPDGIQGSG